MIRFHHFKDQSFGPAPNDGDKLKGDIYWETDNRMDFFAEVKSVDALTFPDNSSELIRNYNENKERNAIKIHDAINQVINYTLCLIKKTKSDQKQRLIQIYFY